MTERELLKEKKEEIDTRIQEYTEKVEELEQELNKKQLDFCKYYIEYKNASKAAKASGYSEKSARKRGSYLLQEEKIHDYIFYTLKIEELKNEISKQEVRQRLIDIIRKNEEVNNTLKIEDLKEILSNLKEEKDKARISETFLKENSKILQNQNKDILSAIKILIDDDNKNNEILLKMEELKFKKSQNVNEFSNVTVIFTGDDEIEE